MAPQDQKLLDRIRQLIIDNWKVDALYLYGSRAHGTAREESDWDLAVLFEEFISDRIEGALRPQEVEAFLERETKIYNRFHVVDLELVPPPLQFNIIRCSRFYDRNVPHVRRVENGIYSTIELDYER